MNRFESLASLFPWSFVLALSLLPVFIPQFAGPYFVLLLGAGAGLLFVGHARTAGPILLVALAMVLFRMLLPPTAEPVVVPFDEKLVREGTGTVVVEANLSRSGEYAIQLRLESVAGNGWKGPAGGHVLVHGLRGPAPALGQRWEWKGTLDGSTLRWQSGTELGWEQGWQHVRWQLRQAIFDQLKVLDEPSAALALALLLGAVDDLTPEEKASFRNAGCSHVLALSGMHLSLLALLLGAVLKRRAHPALVFAATQAVLAAFCVLAGPIPSLYRAWMMALVDGAARWRTTELDPLEVLSLSTLLTLVLWPTMAQTLSLQLSVLSMAGLLLWSRGWEWHLRPWLGRSGGGTLASSLAALGATLPLTLPLFGEVRWIGLLVSAPLVVLTNIYLAASVLWLAVGAWVPKEGLGLIRSGFRGLYDLIFGLTGWGSSWPALAAPVAAALLAMAGLGRAGFFLYNRHHRGGLMPVSLNYDSPTDLQAFLDDRGFNALKRWGQNFLINRGARTRILDALELAPGEAVWEVGPGLGALTHELVSRGHPLTVFEIDPGYALFLRSEFGETPSGFELHEGDVIKTWRSALPADVRSPGIKCVGNLPYNAASAIIADFVEGGYFPGVFVVTVQREMADRMTATVGTKNYSSFSVLCQTVFRLTDVMVLKPGSFYPAPEVTSRVVKLVPHNEYPSLDHKRFSMFVRECFSSRRKTLRNNLPGAAAALRVTDDALKNAFVSEGIDLSRRAETLSVTEFVRVYAATSPASSSRS